MDNVYKIYFSVLLIAVSIVVFCFVRSANAHVLGQDSCVEVWKGSSVSVKCFPSESDKEHNFQHWQDRQDSINQVTSDDVQRQHELRLEEAKAKVLAQELKYSTAGSSGGGISDVAYLLGGGADNTTVTASNTNTNTASVSNVGNS